MPEVPKPLESENDEEDEQEEEEEVFDFFEIRDRVLNVGPIRKNNG